VRARPVIGCSDVTALHIFFSHVWNWPSLRSIEPGANGDIEPGWNQNHIGDTLKVLRGGQPQLSYPLTPLDSVARSAAVLGGLRVVGGNSLLLSAMKGSRLFMPDTADGILFIESFALGPGELSRIRDGFMYSDMVLKARAVMFGDFSQTGGHPNPPGIEFQFEYIQNHFGRMLEPAGIAVLRAEDLFGHGAVNMPLPLHTGTQLTPGASPVLKVSAH
jgi:muramoyltetrapeptide carboxypeptidase